MTNKNLAGFQTLDMETRDAELNWQGTPPAWLNGVLLRTGPAKFEASAYQHWFDGLAMMHRFAFGGGRVLLPATNLGRTTQGLWVRCSPHASLVNQATMAM